MTNSISRQANEMDGVTLQDAAPGDMTSAEAVTRRFEASTQVDRSRPAVLRGWFGTGREAVLGGAALVLLAALLPSWVTDAVKVQQLRGMSPEATADPSLYDQVGSWGFVLRAVIAAAGVLLLFIGRKATREHWSSYVAAAVLPVGGVIAILAAVLAVRA